MKPFRDNWKDKAWKIATAIIVAIIILNPEVAELALFIDAVGLEMFLMLIEVQILLTLGVFYDKIKSGYRYLKKSYLNSQLNMSWQNFKADPQSLLLLVPSQATLMSLLIFSAMIDILYKTV
ncbi:MAG TPA: hypothetical protein EYG68_02485 [Leucothrix mucor]|nr:hypothetical protein [Leucothrix mucor]